MRSFHYGLVVTAALAFGTYAGAAAAGTFTVLYKFADGNTGSPTGKLYLRDGVLYGTGTGQNSKSGAGQVFQLKQSGGKWKLKTLLAFNRQNGADPRGAVVADANDVFYGTAEGRGTAGYGTAFRLWNDGGRWKSATLKNFTWNDAGGAEPNSDLVPD
jgi:hypothetical protein